MAGERTLASLARYRELYKKADRRERSRLLDEFCALTGYHRKYAIALLRQPPDTPGPGRSKRRRGVTYSQASIEALAWIWQAAGYPWSQRLKALLPLWLPWARSHVRGLTPAVEAALLRISARQIDRRLKGRKRELKKRVYGRTKPGTLLKHQIPIRTDNWDVSEPGYCEVDLVCHSGPHASGEYIYSLNGTDLHTGWCETRAIMGRSETAVAEALEAIRQALPLPLKALDSDNGSEFLNHHLVRYCRQHHIAFTRGRPGRKNDNAHIEQKNWTHVRRVFGWDRLDTFEQLAAMNQLYGAYWSPMMNGFQPCVKLLEKVRKGSRVTRRYSEPATPLDRLEAYYTSIGKHPRKLRELLAQRKRTDPFALAELIDHNVNRICKGDLPKNQNDTVLEHNASPRGGQVDQPRPTL